MYRRTKRRFRLLLIAAALVAVSCGQESGSPQGPPDEGSFPVTIQASNGTVNIPSRPEKIVSLSPTATEMLFAIGAGDQVIAVDDQSKDVEVVHGVLGRLELVALAERSLGTLSGGELQRALLARALVQEAPILLLDEPTAALDVGHQQQALELVDEIRGERSLTVLSAMHDLTLASQFAERLLLLAGGRAVAFGEPREVITENMILSHFGATVRVVEDDHGLHVIPMRR